MTALTKGLDQFLKALNGKLPVGRIGILAGRNQRNDSDSSHERRGPGSFVDKKEALGNAEIGAIHEFGEGNMPARSFLRVPISENLQAEMEASKLFDVAEIKELIRTGSLVSFTKKIMICAESCVADAFATGGNGKWPATRHKNKTGMILVDTQQLRNSVTSEVKG